MVRRHGFYGFLTAFCLSVTLAACGDATGPIEAATNTPLPMGPSFVEDVNPILVLHGCTAALCHGSGSVCQDTQAVT